VIQIFVVSKSSGCLDLSESTKKYSMSRTHFNMNKFGGPDEEDYQTVCEVVAKMAEEATGLLVARNNTQYTTHNYCTSSHQHASTGL
jgi:hypothetical protein